MQFVILLSILLAQLLFFFLGGVFSEGISKKSKGFGRIVNFLYTFDSIVLIGYLIYYFIFIYSSKTGLYSIGFNRLILTIIFAITIFTNLFKLYVLLIVRGREKDGFSVLMGTSSFINQKFQTVLGGIYTAFLILTVCGIVTAWLATGTEYEPENGHVLVEDVPYQALDFKKIVSEDEENKEQYVIAITKEDGGEYTFDNSKDYKIAEVKDSPTKHVEKYEAKKVKQNLFFSKEITNYEYIIYTNDENEKSIAEYYVE